MAYLRKRGDSWQAIVRLKGSPAVSGSFPTKKAAELWAQQEEADIRAGRRGKFPGKTVLDAFARYKEFVAPQKRTGAWECVRLDYFLAQFPAWRLRTFAGFSSADASAWRDARLKTTKPSTVLRDLNLLRFVWTIGAREWKWCGENPWANLRVPGLVQARSRIWTWRQIRAMCRRMGYISGHPPLTKSEEVAHAFLLSLRTGMRQGEIAGLDVDRVDLARGVIRLDRHKTLEKAGVRHVPMSPKAVRLLRVLVGYRKQGPLFSTESIEALFRKYRNQLGITGLTFHDARATFCTHAARSLDVMTLAKITGHKDPKQLMTYYRESPESIAARL